MGEQLEMNILSHFTPEMMGKVKGPKLSSYLIALEAWRRGLKVVIHDRRMFNYTVYGRRPSWRSGITLRLSNRILPHIAIGPVEKSCKFRRSEIIDRFARTTRRICVNKNKAKNRLSKAKIPVPEGKRFNATIPDDDVVEYALEDIGFPVVLKPATSSRGKGVFVNINSKEKLKELLIHVREEMGRKSVIIEKHIPGEDYRVFVLSDQVLGAVKRIPANITGDGEQTVTELVEQKNRSRMENPFSASTPIKVDREVLDYLSVSGYSLDSVPQKGETLFLRGKGSGGDLVDATDDISEEIKHLAVRAVKAIPHLHSCGVDILINKNEEGIESGVVIELNDRAHIGLHLFPVRGKARDIPAAIVDYCFPESIKYKGRCGRLYFDPDLAVEPIARGIVSEVSLKPPPPGKIRYRCFEVKGGLQDPHSRIRLQRRALRLDLSGFTRLQSNGNFQVVAAGKSKALRTLRSFLSKRLHATIVGEFKWEKAVAAGFQTE